MNLYLLTPVEDAPEYRFTQHDSAYGFVVAARSPKHARQLVATAKERGDEGHGDEGADFWLTSSDVKLIGTAHPKIKEGVVLRDFNAG